MTHLNEFIFRLFSAVGLDSNSRINFCTVVFNFFSTFENSYFSEQLQMVDSVSLVVVM